MPIDNQSAAIPYSDSTTYPVGTIGYRIQQLLADIIAASVPDGSITAAKLAADAVTTAKILNLNVTTGKIADDAVTYAKLQNISATKRLLGRTTAGAGNAEEIPFSAYMETFLALADEAAVKAAINSEIGIDVQAYNANLAALAGLTGAANKLAYFTGAGALALADFAAAGRALAATGESKDLVATVNNQTGTTYTLASTDRGRVVRLTNAAGITLTLPNNMAVDFYCSVYQGGAGQVALSAAGGGALLNRQSHTKLAGQHSAGGLIVFTNAGGSAAQWTLNGDTAA